MNKNIITEITRINQLMNTSLITEQPGKWKSVAIELISEFSKLSGKLPDEAFNLITKLSKSTDEGEIVKILADLANISNDFYKIIIPKVLSNVSTEVRSKITYTKDLFTRLIKEKRLNRSQANQMVNDIYYDFVDTEFKAVRDMIKKDLDNHIEDIFDKISEPKIIPAPTPKPVDPKVEDLSNEIPDENAIITDSGKYSKIFDVDKWEDASQFGKIDDNAIIELLNQPLSQKITQNLKNILKVTEEKKLYIAKLAKMLETTKNSGLKVDLESKLKKELEWLYKKNTNEFVKMRTHFDDIAKISKVWKDEWNLLKSKTNGGWDFYTVFGSVAQAHPTWERVWNGITDNFRSLFESERSLYNKFAKKLHLPITKGEFIGRAAYNFGTGSRRGFPSLTNKEYAELIKQYGPTAAKVGYFRDIVITTLKWKIYVGLLITVRNALANWFYEDDIQECVDTNNINSEQCRVLNEDWFNLKMAEWSMKYRKNPKEFGDFFGKLGEEIYGWDSGIWDIIEGDSNWKYVGEIVKFDPGFVGEVFNGVVSIINLSQNPLRKEALLKNIEEQIKVGKQELEKSENTLIKTVNEVKEDAKKVVKKVEGDNTTDSLKPI